MKQLRIIMVLDKGLIRLGFQPSPIFSLEVLELTKQTALVLPGFVFLLWVSPVFPVVKSSPWKQLFRLLPNHFPHSEPQQVG